MSVCSARRRESKAKTSSSKRRPVVDPAELQALRTAAEELLQTEIRFIYAAEFEELEGESEPVTAALLLLEELQVSAAEVSKTVSESSADPGSGLNACDPLLTFSQLRLVASIARKFSTSVQDVEEFSSDGSMILLGAIDRFDYSRRFRFSTYATHSIQRHFFRAWKVRQRRRQRFPVTSAEILTEVPEEYNEQPICADPQAVVKELLQQAPDVLDPREHQILLHRFGLGGVSSEARTLREIAADLGVSKERVRQLQLKALEKLRPFLNPAQFNLEAAGV